MTFMTFSGINPLNDYEVEVSKENISISNLTSMKCLDSPVEIVEITYGDKLPTDSKFEYFCYSPQSYLDHLHCSNDVANVTWYLAF